MAIWKSVPLTLIAASACLAQGGLQFKGVRSVPAFDEKSPARVNTIAVADIDNRSGPDLVTVQVNGVLNILYNDSAKRFRREYHNASATAFNPNITYIEVAEVDGDRYPDIVAKDDRNSAFLLFRNNGDGTFADAVSVPVGSSGGATLAGGGLTVADVTSDGKPDVVTVARAFSSESTTLSEQTFVGAGDGTFTALPAVDSTLAGSFFLPPGRSVSISETNRDSKPDLVLQLEQSSPAQTISIGIAPGDGSGSFENIQANGPVVPAGPQPAASLVMADVNGDEFSDAVFLRFSDRVFVALGQSDGTFANPSAVLENLSGAVLLTLGDLNKDSVLDLVVLGSGQFGSFLGKGDGSFQLAGQFTGGYGIYQQPAPVDYNKDGNLDVVWLDYTNGRIGLYAGKGDGRFRGANPVHPADPPNSEWAGNIQVITSGDFNGDSSPDVLVYDWPHASAGGPADLYTGVNNGNAKFAFRLALPPGRSQELAAKYGSFIIDSTSADFNGDRRPDIILRTEPGLSILLAQADGTLNPNPIDLTFPVPVGCRPVNFLSTADVNADGFEDIVAGYSRNANCPAGASTPSGIFTMLGDGKGHFTGKFTPFGNSVFFVRVGELSGDNKPDLVVADLLPTGGFRVLALAGNGDGSFNVEIPKTVISDRFISNILIADYNGDGRNDLTLSDEGAVVNGQAQNGTQRVLLLPGMGDLAFGEPVSILPGQRTLWNGTAYSDLNGDGRLDLVLATYAKSEPYNSTFGMVTVANLGGGKFGKPHSELLPLGVAGRNPIPFVADFNRDGLPDVLLGSDRSSPLFLNRSRNSGDVPRS